MHCLLLTVVVAVPSTLTVAAHCCCFRCCAGSSLMCCVGSFTQFKKMHSISRLRSYPSEQAPPFFFSLSLSLHLFIAASYHWHVGEWRSGQERGVRSRWWVWWRRQLAVLGPSSAWSAAGARRPQQRIQCTFRGAPVCQQQQQHRAVSVVVWLFRSLPCSGMWLLYMWPKGCAQHTVTAFHNLQRARHAAGLAALVFGVPVVVLHSASPTQSCGLDRLPSTEGKPGATCVVHACHS